MDKNGLPYIRTNQHLNIIHFAGNVSLSLKFEFSMYLPQNCTSRLITVAIFPKHVVTYSHI